MTLRFRLLLVLLIVVIGVLLPLWALLSYRVTRHAEAQMIAVLFERIEFVTFDYPYLQTPSPTVLEALRVELAREARELHSWGFVLEQTGEVWFTDSQLHPLPTPGVRAQLNRGLTAEYRTPGALVHVRSTGWGSTIGLAGPLTGVAALTAALGQTYLLGASLLVLAMTLAGWALLQVGLRPLRRMAAHAEVLSAASLRERLGLPASHDEVRSLALSLNRMLERLEKSFQALRSEEARTRQFAADASHELRTPLTALGGYLELLGSAPDDLVVKTELLLAAQQEARRANRLVEDLLTLARLDAGEELRREIVVVSSFMESFAASVRRAAPDYPIHVEVQEDDDAARPLTAWADPLRLEQALWNLVRNAVRIAPAGSAVTIRAEARPGAVWWAVEDAGPGFAPEVLARGFERFYRGEQGGDGAGLGLAIVRSIAEAHGGQVGIENRSVVGACVWLTVSS